MQQRSPNQPDKVPDLSKRYQGVHHESTKVDREYPASVHLKGWHPDKADDWERVQSILDPDNHLPEGLRPCPNGRAWKHLHVYQWLERVSRKSFSDAQDSGPTDGIFLGRGRSRWWQIDICHDLAAIYLFIEDLERVFGGHYGIITVIVVQSCSWWGGERFYSCRYAPRTREFRAGQSDGGNFSRL